VRNAWQKAAKLLLSTAKEKGDIALVTKQIELALFMQGKWLLKDRATEQQCIIQTRSDRRCLVERYGFGGLIFKAPPAQTAHTASALESAGSLRPRFSVLRSPSPHLRRLEFDDILPSSFGP
jgi:hypothetical protein